MPGIMNQTSIIVLLLAVAAAAAAVFLVTDSDAKSPPPVKIETLDDWVDFTQRSGFELLDKRASDDYFIAIYRTAADEVAFCYRWRGEGDEPSTSLAVRDERMESLRDGERSGETTALNDTGALPAGGFVQGMVIPIRKDYTGPVAVVFRDNRDDRDAKPDREVYLRTVTWGG
ncbi:MAG: hypothetical protein QNJ98_14735 [Planctomycetota bacterium]|nr:hypothetical protein [Planctomycetota bacterium]